MGMRGASDPAGRPQRHFSSPRPAPGRAAPPAPPRSAPPVCPPPSSPTAPLPGSRRVPGRRGAAGRSGRQLAPRRWRFGRSALPPARSLRRVEPAVQAAARRWGPGAGGREAAAAAEAGPRAAEGALQPLRQPGLGPRPARPHGPAPRAAVLSVAPALCALRHRGQQDPRCVRVGCAAGQGSGMPEGQGGPRVPREPGSVEAGGRWCPH